MLIVSAWDRFCRREYDKLAIEEDEDEDSRDDIAEVSNVIDWY